VRARVDGIDWATATADLDEAGVASLGPVLTVDECAALRDAFDDDARYRSTIDMTRYRFGSGTYRYYAYPHPEPLRALRRSLWPHLLPIARSWADRRGQAASWPDEFDAWIERCHAHGQSRPTPLILRYGPGDWNALHRDLYGELVFPLQVTVMLDRPDVDFTGGDFLLVEQRPRMQSRGHAIALGRGDAVVFPCRTRAASGTRGSYQVGVRHGVSTVLSGRRTTLGIIFHDAR